MTAQQHGISVIDLRERLALGIPLDQNQRDWLLDLLRVPHGLDGTAAEAEHSMEVLARASSFHPFLRGLDAGTCGAILADLLATWVLGHAPELRHDMLKLHLQGVVNLVKAGPDPWARKKH